MKFFDKSNTLPKRTASRSGLLNHPKSPHTMTLEKNTFQRCSKIPDGGKFPQRQLPSGAPFTPLRKPIGFFPFPAFDDVIVGKLWFDVPFPTWQPPPPQFVRSLKPSPPSPVLLWLQCIEIKILIVFTQRSSTNNFTFIYLPLLAGYPHFPPAMMRCLLLQARDEG